MTNGLHVLLPWVFVFILMIATFILAMIVRGALNADRQERNKMNIRRMTGREIETMRRRLVAVGNPALNLSDTFSLILTIREIQLGTYTDDDPWIPADPYEDVAKSIDQ